MKDDKCINKLIKITNTCIDLCHWPFHFKTSTMIVISKLNKMSYDSTKSFCPIVLLNTTGKLFKKMIREQLQFLLISNNFIHPCQLDNLKHCSFTDAGVALTHIIHSDWVKNLYTSIVASDIVQFFFSLNHQLLPLILNKADFNHKVLKFFRNLSYASPPVWKLHPCSDITSQLYKPIFYGSHLSHNTPYSSAATIQVFHLLQ